MMKKKIIILGLMMILFCNFFANASTVDKENNMAPLSHDDEIYYVYGRNAYSVLGHGPDSWEPWGDHGIRLSPGSLFTWPVAWDDCEACYNVYLDCSEKGFVNGKFTLGVFYKDISSGGNGPDMWIKNPNTGDWYQKGSWNPIGKPSSLTWKYFDIDESYVDTTERKIQVKFYAEWNDDTYLDMLSVEFKDNEETDQSLTDFSGSSESGYYAQSFIPNFEKLTRVKVLLDNDIVNNVETFDFCISSSINPLKPITETHYTFTTGFDCQIVPGPKRWAVANLPDVELVPNKVYYLCMDLRSSNGISWQYSSNSGYADGSYFLDGDDLYNDWKKSAGKKYCIKTYGTSTSDFDEELTTNPANGGLINFGSISGSEKKTISFKLINSGDKGSALKWEIKDNPNWITFSDDEGILYNSYVNNGNYQDIDVTVNTKNLEGSKEGQEYSSSFKVYNKETGENSKINVKVIVIKNRAYYRFRDIASQNFIFLKLLHQVFSIFQ